jgi:hypothetical protein
MPVDQVAAMENWQPGVILECRGDQIIVVTNPANGRVRITTWKDGVAESPAH